MVRGEGGGRIKASYIIHTNSWTQKSLFMGPQVETKLRLGFEKTPLNDR